MSLARRAETESQIEEVQTPGVLPASTHEILYEIETQRMTLCYKMLLLTCMADLADANGRVSIRAVAERFQEFFISRSVQKKAEENPNLVAPGTLSGRTMSAWERVIREQPVRYLTAHFVVDEGTSTRWAPRIWSQWSPELQREIRNAAFDRLVRYFNRNVPGGY